MYSKPTTTATPKVVIHAAVMTLTLFCGFYSLKVGQLVSSFAATVPNTTRGMYQVVGAHVTRFLSSQSSGCADLLSFVILGKFAKLGGAASRL